MNESTIFCVVGMHRSGTSLFAHWLYDSGIFMGKNFLGPASSNRKGHFEDEDFLKIHCDDLLDKAFDISGYFIDDKPLFFSEKSHIIAEKLVQERNHLHLWGWKEPRTTLYLKQWKLLIPTLKVIALKRDKHDVALSLYIRLKRHKWYKTRNPLKQLYWWFDINLGRKKWLERFKQIYAIYNNRIEEYKNAGHEILIIELEHLIKEPELYSREISKFLDLKFNLSPFENIYDKELISHSNKK